MKKLIVNDVELDVSEMTNSDLYRLTEELAKCNPSVIVKTEQVNEHILERVKDGIKHVKAYKFKPTQWAGKHGYEMRKIKPTNILSQAESENTEGEFMHEGIPFTKAAMDLLQVSKTSTTDSLSHLFSKDISEIEKLLNWLGSPSKIYKLNCVKEWTPQAIDLILSKIEEEPVENDEPREIE